MRCNFLEPVAVSDRFALFSTPPGPPLLLLSKGEKVRTSKEQIGEITEVVRWDDGGISATVRLHAAYGSEGLLCVEGSAVPGEDFARCNGPATPRGGGGSPFPKARAGAVH